jgi:hypothetical protein
MVLEDIMKRIVTLSVLVIILSGLNLYSQLFTPYLAKDQYDAAKKSALDSGMVSPELIGVGTAPGTYSISDQLPDITLTVDLKTGKATAWLYLFRSSVDTTKQAAVAVVKTILGTIALQMPLGQLGALPTSDALDLTKYINSDKMAENLSKNSDYINFMKNDSATVALIGLYFNKINFLPPVDKAIYALRFTSTIGEMLCSVDAITGAVQCLTIPTAVQDLTKDNASINVFPNPAGKEVYIHIPAVLQSENSTLAIYDSFGDLVTEIYNYPKTGELENVSLPLGNLSSGTYFVRFISNGQVFSSQFVVEK